MNINRVWTDLLVEELIRCGVDYFCIAPGSRSAPLVTAVASHPKARHLVHFDERGTAFAALGYARATGRPAAWITTSGTAVANGMPAVVEAATDGVPMILLTADRPPELRDTGANQTIDQVAIFGRYVRWQVDLPPPDRSIAPETVLTTVDQAVFRARRMPAGPVHLNCMFREPLAPEDDGQDYRAYLAGVEAWRRSSRPYTWYAPTAPLITAETADRLSASISGVSRGIVVAGRLASPVQADAVRSLADRLNWPLLADVGSHLRFSSPATTRADYFDVILAGDAFRQDHRPEAVLQVGARITSKRLLQYLEASHPSEYILACEDPSRLDPAQRVTSRVEADVAQFCDAMVAALDRRVSGVERGPVAAVAERAPAATDPAAIGAGARGAERAPAATDASAPGPGNGPAAAADRWASSWRTSSAEIAARLDDFFRSQATLSEPLVARLISQAIPPEHGLCLASSMPVRDMDMFAAPDGSAVRVATNRGASGIDGTIATAYGFAQGLRSPVTAVVGDLALLHDLNSLALLRDSDTSVVVVAVNNRGGGIFSFLPIARHREVFEPFFGTPHDLSFEPAAKMFGLVYINPRTPAEFVSAYGEAFKSGVSYLIEINTDRAENVAAHAELIRIARGDA